MVPFFYPLLSEMCFFCQNYVISHLGEGDEITDKQVADIMVSLQRQGCHNINLVTPSHVVPQILAALPRAIDQGLSIPLVYNSSGYDFVETLKLLRGVIDLYLPDYKFWQEESAKRFAKAPDYPEIARAALSEMYRQVGSLLIDRCGIAEKGLLVRHLAMPDGIDESRKILNFLAREISLDTYVNIMDQYRPSGLAKEYPLIDRSLASGEYENAMQCAMDAGLTRLDKRDWSGFLRQLGII